MAYVRILVRYVKSPPPLGLLGLLALTGSHWTTDRGLNLETMHELTDPLFQPGVPQSA
ncbi:hypothetical protein PHAVU_009G195700 [Phaseolus vulgaris]|uniref:Uncharacterized protein n=1 Tax=Phaseolus vulgaris TaxID=3885 RepID=V7B083_PHAVU|nr:hypothetical protein PHAVU_009G195700g [Phaseolus vulgaris]ESW10278.1 hypothetical protein PHAVU_009G195700g [Phaseolus vulgaris]